LDLPEDQRSEDGHTLLLKGFIGAANEDWLALRDKEKPANAMGRSDEELVVMARSAAAASLAIDAQNRDIQRKLKNQSKVRTLTLTLTLLLLRLLYLYLSPAEELVGLPSQAVLHLLSRFFCI
jgi:hypothetical protein